jgi:hypothetical protein
MHCSRPFTCFVSSGSLREEKLKKPRNIDFIKDVNLGGGLTTYCLEDPRITECYTGYWLERIIWNDLIK